MSNKHETIVTRLEPEDGDMFVQLIQMMSPLLRTTKDPRVRAIIQPDRRADADAWENFLRTECVQALFAQGVAASIKAGDPQEVLVRRFGDEVHIIVQDVGLGEPLRRHVYSEPGSLS